MKKLILLGFIITILLTGCQVKNFKYYKNISDKVISFYNTDEYNKEKIFEEDFPAINTFLSELTHKDQIVNISDYITKSQEYYTSESNTNGVWVDDDTCYIKYNELGLFNTGEDIESDTYEIELNKRIVCNNYYTILYESYFYPNYNVTKSNPRYNYIYLDGNTLDTGYEFIYRSSYDGTGMKVNIVLKDKKIIDINTSIIDVTGYIK